MSKLYKEMIIKLIEKIEDEKILRHIYIFIKNKL